ncbi:class II fructose-bisphosphate aldolase [Georgenia halophila]|uniref:Class II fructose-bisphosphate aldolase n=1 Tax=Georgenia halophila TaxID=620889 RepID=A0ABP8L2L8_9MICO
MLTDLTSVAARARAAGRGLGAFNVVHLEHAETFVAAAERVRQPVVLQVSQNAVRYHGPLAPIGAGVLEVAHAAQVPVVVHLDHAEDTDLVREAVALGFTSVMYDGARRAFADNVATTAEVVAHAHAHGVSVEAEIGEVGGKTGPHDPSARTDPDEAADFMALTGVDLLAVAVGSSHAMTHRGARLDTDLIRAIGRAVDVPLVLHGSSGVADDEMRRAIEAGMTKINVSTHLNRLFTTRAREALDADPDVVDTRRWFRPGNAAIGDEVARLLTLYAG